MITISKYSQAPTFSSESCETLKLKVGLSSAANISPDLLSLNYDNLSSIEELEALVEGIKQDVKRKEILAQHKPAIKQLPSGKWYTRINGKKYERVNKKDLEYLIINSYNSLNQVNLNSIFNSYLLYRKKSRVQSYLEKRYTILRKLYQEFKPGSERFGYIVFR